MNQERKRIAGGETRVALDTHVGQRIARSGGWRGYDKRGGRTIQANWEGAFPIAGRKPFYYREKKTEVLEIPIDKRGAFQQRLVIIVQARRRGAPHPNE